MSRHQRSRCRGNAMLEIRGLARAGAGCLVGRGNPAGRVATPLSNAKAAALPSRLAMLLRIIGRLILEEGIIVGTRRRLA